MKFLYVFKSSSGLIKVGIAGDVERRRRQLERASGYVLELVSSFGPFFAAAEVESGVHSRLASFRACGEWFSTSSEVVIQAVESEILDSNHMCGDQVRELAASIDRARIANDQARFEKMWNTLHPNGVPDDPAEMAVNGYIQAVEAYSKLNADFKEAVEMLDEARCKCQELLSIAERFRQRVNELESENRMLKQATPATFP